MKNIHLIKNKFNGKVCIKIHNKKTIKTYGYSYEKLNRDQQGEIIL